MKKESGRQQSGSVKVSMRQAAERKREERGRTSVKASVHRTKRFHYAWVIFGACFVMVFTVLGFTSSTKGLYLAAITEDLGIPRSLFSINDSCRYLTTAIVNLFFGRIVLKAGPRRMILWGFLALIGSCLVYSFSNTIPAFCIGGMLLGLGGTWTTTTIVGYLVGKWFTSAKGTIMGIILAANGLGGALASQVLTPVIYGNKGWRASYRLTILILAVVGTAAVLLIRNKPEDVGEKPLGSGTVSQSRAKRSREENAWMGITFEEAKKTGYFYAAMLCVFLTGLVLQSTTGISSARMKDVGIDPKWIATVLSVHSLALAAAKMLTGISFDKLGLRKTMLMCYGCAITALLLLASLRTNSMALVYGLISSFGLPLETVMLPLIAIDLFGDIDFGRMLGICVSCNVAGYALGTPLVNAVYDRTGSYRVILIILAGVMACVMVVRAAHGYAENGGYHGSEKDRN